MMKECAWMLVLMVTVAVATWSPKVRIDKCKTDLRRAKLYVDQKSKTSHIFWCELNLETGKYSLLYRRQYSNDALSPIAMLDIEHSCEMVSVYGPHDGEEINVAYGASRRTLHTHCSQENRDGCLDVYALDSNDGGFTFSKPAVIMRGDTNDVWNRKYPKILANPKTGRQWIFYVLANVESTKFSIGFVTRADGAINYSSEHLLGFRKEMIMEASVAQSIYKGRHLLHLVWTGEVNGKLMLMQAISSTNGATWGHSIIIGEGFAGRFYSHIKMDPSYMVLPWLKTATAPPKLEVTHDNTQHWQGLQISQHTGIPEVEICYKHNKNDGIVFSMLNAELGKNKFEGQFGTMHIPSNHWVRGANPFGTMNMAYDPNVGCYMENDKYVVKAVGIENVRPVQNSIYLVKASLT